MEYNIPKPRMNDPVYKAGKLVGNICSGDWNIWYSPTVFNPAGLKFSVNIMNIVKENQVVKCFVYWRIASADERDYKVEDRWEHLYNIGETKLESSISVPN